MLGYQETEKRIYDWLKAKHAKNSSFNFSLRRNGLPGSETDYFIGTEKGRYLGTTFWFIPVAYPGSSGDLIDLIVKLRKNDYRLEVEFTQTENPQNPQNKYALDLIKRLKPILANEFGLSKESGEGAKMFSYKIGGPKKGYTDIEELIIDADMLLDRLIPIVNKEINQMKVDFPEFDAGQITKDEFIKMEEGYQRRLEKYGQKDAVAVESTFKELLKQFNDEELSYYFNVLKNILQHFDLEKGDERLVFSIADGKLNFMITQRYCWNLFPSHQDGNFGIISSNKLKEISEPFKGNDDVPFFTHFSFDEIRSLNTKSSFEAMESELLRSDKSSHRRFNNHDFEEYAFNLISSRAKHNLNTILFGPPGTGKTYHTVDKAVQIISPGEYASKDHESNKEVYDRLVKEGSILFSTFHQSMSYEDFIEGIKPVMKEVDNDKEGLLYELKPGIFKVACAKAAYNCYLKSGVSASKKVDFDTLYEAFLELVRKGIKDDKFVLCKTIQGADVEIFKVTRNGSVRARAKDSTSESVAPLTKGNIEKLYNQFDSIDEIESLQDVRDTVQVSPRITEFYAVFNRLKEFEETFAPTEQDQELKGLVGLEDEEIMSKFDDGVFNDAAKAYGESADPIVLILDEINRGNVSSIFGELITLLETDKRKGGREELSVILPYSGKEFFVPQNLYILGTMNTADRSVEALDTALRRRFSFIEMMPKPKVLVDDAGMNLSINGQGEIFELAVILEKINERIEILVDRDHTIGHSYFFNLEDLNDLKNTFHKNIIPLLQEYFYGSYEKIELVIGANFFNKQDRSKVTFAVRDSEFAFEGNAYKIKDSTKMSDEDFTKAIYTLIHGEQ